MDGAKETVEEQSNNTDDDDDVDIGAEEVEGDNKGVRVKSTARTRRKGNEAKVQTVIKIFGL
jgi:hypothetical protein